MNNGYFFSNIDINTFQTESVAQYISLFQEKEHTLTGNFGRTVTEIKNQIQAYLRNQPRSFFQVATDDSGKIRGFSGLFFSDSNTVRLLGPFATGTSNEWMEISDIFFKRILERCKPWRDIKIRIAFTNKNAYLKQFCESHGFMQYNAERSMVLDRKKWQKEDLKELTAIGVCKVRDYQASDFTDFLKIHPGQAYFDASTIVKNLNNFKRLMVAELDNRVVGYVFSEDFTADGYSDVCFLNVLPSARNQRIGSMLLKKAIEDSFQKSYVKRIEISVRVNNIAAFRLYKRLGFKETVTYVAYELIP